MVSSSSQLAVQHHPPPLDGPQFFKSSVASIFPRFDTHWISSCVKQRVYKTPIADLMELRGCIEQAFLDLPMEMVNRSIHSYRRRLHRCIEVDGKSVEINF